MIVKLMQAWDMEVYRYIALPESMGLIDRRNEKCVYLSSVQNEKQRRLAGMTGCRKKKKKKKDV